MSLRKTMLVGLSLLLLLSASANAASKVVNWTFSGSAIANVALEDSTDPAFCTVMSLIDVEAKGSPGPANIRGLNRKCFFQDGSPSGGENSLVARFNDGSLLNMLVDTGKPSGVISFDPETGGVEIEFSVYFNGGFGRFSEATGEADVWLYAEPVGSVEVAPGELEFSSLRFEYGTFTGHIEY